MITLFVFNIFWNKWIYKAIQFSEGVSQMLRFKQMKVVVSECCSSEHLVASSSAFPYLAACKNWIVLVSRMRLGMEIEKFPLRAHHYLYRSQWVKH